MVCGVCGVCGVCVGDGYWGGDGPGVGSVVRIRPRVECHVGLGVGGAWAGPGSARRPHLHGRAIDEEAAHATLVDVRARPDL